MNQAQQDEMKKEAAFKAAQKVVPNSVLGVGTGSTVKFFIDALAEREKKTPLNLKAIITTSRRSREQLEGYGFHVNELSEVSEIDLTVDGADRVDAQLNGIKGGGGALTLEKNVAANSKRNLWIVDESKVVARLSGFDLPVEVLPVSCRQVQDRLEKAGLHPHFRLTAAKKRYVTHYGNYILDCAVDPIPVPVGLAVYLDQCVGVVEHGLFLNICDEVLIAHHDGTIEDRQR